MHFSLQVVEASTVKHTFIGNGVFINNIITILQYEDSTTIDKALI